MYSNGLLLLDIPVLNDQQNIHQLCADSGCRLDNLPSLVNDRDE